MKIEPWEIKETDDDISKEVKQLANRLLPSVTFSFNYEYSDIPVRGNAVGSDDPKFDRGVEDDIIDRLDRGDLAAWFDATCVAEWKGFEGRDYLGACSYESLDEFETSGGYVEDMKAEALLSLAYRLRAIRQKLDSLES